MSKQPVPAVVEPSVPSPQARPFSEEVKRDSVRLGVARHGREVQFSGGGDGGGRQSEEPA